MYTEENEKRYDLRGILLKVILGLIIVLLIIWLIPKFTGNNNSELANTPSYAAVYKENVDQIKEAGLEYYTEEKLPTAENELVNITIDELIEAGYLKEIIDADKNSCNTKDSFISVNYIESNEYELSIRLICDKQNQASSYTVYKNSECDTTLCKDQTNEDESTNEDKEENNTTTEPEETTKQPVTNSSTDISQYEYYFVTPVGASAWSEWTEWTQDPTKTVTSSKCNNNDTNCNKEIESKVEFITTGIVNLPYNQSYKALVNKGSYTSYLCTGNTYQKIDNTLYSYTGGSFELVGQINTKTAPQDTYNTRYEFVGVDFTACGASCYEDLESYIYNKYVYTGTVVKYDNNTSCTKETISVPIYQTENKIVSEIRQENMNQYVRFYRERTRTITQEHKVEYKWSTYNDQSLLSNGWEYTGKTK